MTDPTIVQSTCNSDMYTTSELYQIWVKGYYGQIFCTSEINDDYYYLLLFACTVPQLCFSPRFSFFLCGSDPNCHCLKMIPDFYLLETV